ncbi:MBL fold metallo-hydrolase [Sphingomonas sp. NBWT7]|nr:MBL fold metallo-hydrolase [Sphingomonas sp. NBWT7]
MQAGLLGAVIGSSGLGTAAMAQQTPYATINAAAEASPVTVQPLRGNVSLLQGSGGNMAAFAGAEGMFLVDDGISLSKDKIEVALRGISPAPIRYAVNTHWHWDHADGNEWTHRAGAVLIAHANTARHLDQTIRVEEWGHTFTPVSQDARIAQLVRGEKSMQFGGETIRLRPYVPSHTDGDLSAYFTKADVLLTGDTWWNGLYPFIDYVAGGSIDGMIRAAEANVAMAGSGTIVVPGHGPVGGRKGLVEYRNMLVAIRANVAALKKQGKTLEETIAARPTADFDDKWGKAIISPALFTTLVFRGV